MSGCITELNSGEHDCSLHAFTGCWACCEVQTAAIECFQAGVAARLVYIGSDIPGLLIQGEGQEGCR